MRPAPAGPLIQSFNSQRDRNPLRKLMRPAPAGRLTLPTCPEVAFHLHELQKDAEHKVERDLRGALARINASRSCGTTTFTIAPGGVDPPLGVDDNDPTCCLRQLTFSPHSEKHLVFNTSLQ